MSVVYVLELRFTLKASSRFFWWCGVCFSQHKMNHKMNQALKIPISLHWL